MINPKELIRTISIKELNLSADQYFKSIVNVDHLYAKPFTNFEESTRILKSLGSLLDGLQLSKTMKVLDFGAGSCWLSRILSQMQCEVIACDVSATALEIGKRLFEKYPIVGNPIAPPKFLVFDGYRIDLPDKSVDRIICNDAFHHIPNQEKVLSELCRVLKDGGIAGFSEPGPFHSSSPVSQYEMQNYNVLENDIIIPEIYDIAKRVGFDAIKFKMNTDIDINLEEYIAVKNNNISVRTNEKLIDKVQRLNTNQTIFFLSKGKIVVDSTSREGLAHSILTPGSSYKVKHQQTINIPLEITNEGKAKWLIENVNNIGIVRIGVHLYNEDGKLLDLNFARYGLAEEVYPGKTLSKTISVQLKEIGKYKLGIDLVSEEVSWFAWLGSKPILIDVEIV